MAESGQNQRYIRPRSWISLFLASRGWGAIAALAAMVLLTALSVRALNTTDQYGEEAVVAQAVIAGKRVRQIDDQKNYYVRFVFTPETREKFGRRVSKEHRVSWSYYSDLRLDETVPIRYLVEDPAGFEYLVNESRYDHWVLQVLALVAGLVGLVALWAAGKRANLAVLARSKGQIEFGAVVSVVDDNGIWGLSTGKGRLVWRDRYNRRFVGMVQELTALKPYQPGAKIQIFMRNGESWWVGDIGPRI